MNAARAKEPAEETPNVQRHTLKCRIDGGRLDAAGFCSRGHNPYGRKPREPRSGEFDGIATRVPDEPPSGTGEF